jgi:ABC-2 type transport system permease protein
MGEALAAVIRRELAWLRGSPWDLTLVSLAPLAVLAMISWMFVASVAERLPVAYVDQDHSAASRQLLRNLEASPRIAVTERPVDLADAWPLIRSGKVWAIIYAPPNTEREILAGRKATVFVYQNAAFYSLGAMSALGASEAIAALAADMAPRLAQGRGLPLPHLAAPHVQSTVLYNPQLSYEWFLEALLQPGVLHLMMSCVIVMAIGRELAEGTARDWLGERPLIALAGKLAPYVVIFTGWNLLGVGWLCGVRGWGVHGSLGALIAGQLLLYASYAALAALVVLGVKNIATALSAVAIYGGPAITFSNATLPTIDAPLFTQIWSRALPFTAYVELQMQQMFMGAPAAASAGPLLALLTFTLIPFALAALLARRLLHRSAPEAAP